jgi:putative cell wall-binding protein
MRCARTLLIGVLVVVVLGLPGADDVQAGAPSPAAWDLVAAVNAERFNVGLPPLAVLVSILDLSDKQATKIAADQALSHNPQLAADMDARVSGWTGVGENVAYASSVAAVHSALMASPPHRANILGDYNYIAITVVEQSGTLWVAEVFAKAPAGLQTLTRVPMSRVGDGSNVAASITASKALFGNGSAGAVVVARQDVFADALAGGALAGARSGPVLLSEHEGARPELVAEAKRVLKPGGSVFLMGGTAALSDAVERAFRDAGLATTRVAGANRFETAALVAPLVTDAPTTILITSGMNFPDAMGATPVSGRLRAPIILADGDSIPTASLSYLAAHPTPSRIVFGGRASVGDTAAAEALATERVAGNDRFETATAVAERWFGGSDALVLVTGSTFQDAAIAGPMAAALGGPVILTAAPPTSGTYGYFRGHLRGLHDVRVVGTSDEVTPPTVALLLS